MMSSSSSSVSGTGLTYCKGLKAEKTAQLMSRTEKAKERASATEAPMPKMGKSSEIGVRMRQLEDAMTKNNFVKATDRLEKSDPNYGRPQEGTKTAERGARANKHVHREILELIEVIYMSGFPVDGAEDEHVSVMFFGDLFRVYTRISDKVVGILLRAKKYGLLYFEPEMLFQGRHDDVPVVMTRPMHEIYFEYNQNDKTFVMPAAAVSASAGEGALREKR